MLCCVWELASAAFSYDCSRCHRERIYEAISHYLHTQGERHFLGIVGWDSFLFFLVSDLSVMEEQSPLNYGKGQTSLGARLNSPLRKHVDAEGYS